MFGGLVLFGIACLQRRLFARWNFLPLLSSLPWVLAITITFIYQALTHTDLQVSGLAAFLLFGIPLTGLVLTGIQLQAEAVPLKAALE